MPLYRASVTQFRVQMMDGSLVPTLTTQYRHHMAHNPAPAEVRSWERSLHALSADLIQAGLDDVEVLVEHQLPLTSKRADVVLCGVHPRTGDPSYVVVELKQWSEDAGFTARISAGYCWPWRDARPDGSLPDDVTVGDWKRPWNNKKETSVGGAPGRSFWSSDRAGFGQVGCVYTAQGFEYDWSGVIMGPDLVWRDDRWVAQPGESHDSAVRRAPLADFDRAVRNTYKVLLTRGMAGSVVFSSDPETQAMLGSLLGRLPAVTS